VRISVSNPLRIRYPSPILHSRCTKLRQTHSRCLWNSKTSHRCNNLSNRTPTLSLFRSRHMMASERALGSFNPFRTRKRKQNRGLWILLGQTKVLFTNQVCRNFHHLTVPQFRYPVRMPFIEPNFCKIKLKASKISSKRKTPRSAC
jgi:hypothetical protein